MSSSDTNHGLFLMQITSAISSISCLITIYIIYKKKILNSSYNYFILYITISDFLSSASLVIGSDSISGSPLCFFQGFTNNVFTLSSFFWSTAISYEVWAIVRNVDSRIDDVISYKSKLLHLICWGLPILITLIPTIFTKTSFSNDDFTPGWCFYSDNGETDSILFWFFFEFYLWFVVCVFLMFFCISLSIFRLKSVYKGKNSSLNLLCFRLFLFPLVIVICWLEPFIGDIYFIINYNQSPQTIWIYLAYILPSLQGLLSVIIFFVMNYDFSKWSNWNNDNYINSYEKDENEDHISFLTSSNIHYLYSNSDNNSLNIQINDSCSIYSSNSSF